jgi:hypothetical protein
MKTLRYTTVCPILWRMKTRCGYQWLSALSFLWCLSVFAATVYKSIDENGVVTYSDTRPAQDILVETLEIDVPASPPGEQSQQRLQDMRDTTDRMVADRMAREKQRAETRQLDAQIAAQKAALERADYNDDDSNYTGYYDYPARRPWWPAFHPRPGYPIAHPPLLPPVGQHPPNIRPLPSNDYPASLIRKSYDPKVQEAFR